MIYRLLLNIFLISLGFICFAETVKAEGNGENPGNCILEVIEPGNLELETPQVLSSQLSPENSATVFVSCNQAANLKITTIEAANNNPTRIENLSATATSSILNPNNIQLEQDGEIAAGAIGEVFVNMRASHSTVIPPGKYSFTVTITVTP